MEITYFEVYLKDGTTFDFDYKCNHSYERRVIL